MSLAAVNLSAVGIEEVEWSEFTSSWSMKFMDELGERKYAHGFDPKYIDVLNWAFKHKNKIKDMPFDEQEKMMIMDGIISAADI